MNLLPWFAILLLVTAAFFFLTSRAQRKESGIPQGRIVYADPGLWGKVEKPFFDAETMLTGKPDYLVKKGDAFLPVEVKSGFGPVEPYGSHVFQLMAYCLLVERSLGVRPPHGILKYRNRTFEIDYTDAQEALVLQILDEMRQDERTGCNDRSHNEPGRCSRCGYRSICDQKL